MPSTGFLTYADCALRLAAWQFGEGPELLRTSVDLSAIFHNLFSDLELELCCFRFPNQLARHLASSLPGQVSLLPWVEAGNQTSKASAPETTQAAAPLAISKSAVEFPLLRNLNDSKGGASRMARRT